MSVSTSSTSSQSLVYSFVTNKKGSCQSVELLETTTTLMTASTTPVPSNVQFQILKGSLTANNKFYIAFGDKPPFNFFQLYPVDTKGNSHLVIGDGDGNAVSSDDGYVHPVVWGIAQLIKKPDDNPAVVGSKYLALLPMAERVSFVDSTSDAEGRNLTVDRPMTNPFYNVFTKLDDDDPLLSPQYGDLALACFPGIITGFGLFFTLERRKYFGGVDAVVITAASSKVALALSIYLKKNKLNSDKNKVKVIGYTSQSNIEFCERTGLYDQILKYEDKLDGTVNKAVLIDISGKSSVYRSNQAVIVKLLALGNASGTPDQLSTFSTFSLYATVKLMISMMGLPSWMHRWMNPVQELFLIMDIQQELISEWGIETFRRTSKEYSELFCQEASKWITVRECKSESTIQNAFEEIIQGTVPPSETIVVDIIKAVAHRRT